MKTCEQCGTAFDPKNERPSHPAKYCSRACRDAAQRTLVTLMCRQCGKSFHRKAYMRDWSQERGPFCGFACYGRWQSEHTQGPQNPNYTPSSPLRDNYNYQETHRQVLERDCFRCQDCGSQESLHVHHLGDTHNHAPDNLLTLCASCHHKRHPVPHDGPGVAGH